MGGTGADIGSFMSSGRRATVSTRRHSGRRRGWALAPRIAAVRTAAIGSCGRMELNHAAEMAHRSETRPVPDAAQTGPRRKAPRS